MVTFSVGDTVCWRNRYTATITHIIERRLYGNWYSSDDDRFRDSEFFLYPDTCMKLISPVMMQYDPAQQGDTDEDI